MTSQQKNSTQATCKKANHVSEPLIRSVRSTKILPRHLERSAIVYVRQSTPMQVLEHVESSGQIADGLTKGLRKDRHMVFVRQLNMQTAKEFKALITAYGDSGG